MEFTEILSCSVNPACPSGPKSVFNNDGNEWNLPAKPIFYK